MREQGSSPARADAASGDPGERSQQTLHTMKMNALLIIPLLWLGTGACSSANEEIPGPLPPAPDTYVPGSTAGIDGDVRIGIASGEASEYQPGENRRGRDRPTFLSRSNIGSKRRKMSTTSSTNPVRMLKTACSESSNSSLPPRLNLNTSRWVTTISR